MVIWRIEYSTWKVFSLKDCRDYRWFEFLLSVSKLEGWIDNNSFVYYKLSQRFFVWQQNATCFPLVVFTFSFWFSPYKVKVLHFFGTSQASFLFLHCNDSGGHSKTVVSNFHWNLSFKWQQKKQLWKLCNKDYKINYCLWKDLHLGYSFYSMCHCLNSDPQWLNVSGRRKTPFVGI